MSEQISEQISALLDGELPEAELSLLLRQIERQPSVLEQAYRVQQAHICSQGEAPISLSDTLSFSTRLHSAIREQDLNSDFVEDQENIALVSVNQHESKSVTNQQALTNSSIRSGQAASNDSRWRPLLGAGVAAAVALIAVNAWQYQGQNVDGLDSGSLEVNNNEFTNFETPTQIQTADTALKVSDIEVDNNSYTVPNFENLNIDSPIVLTNDFRQVGYSDSLLQNNVAPQSTIKNLSRFAQEQRATIYQEETYIDPRSGLIVISTRAIIEE